MMLEDISLSPSIVTVLGWVGAAFVTYHLAVVIYRLTLHPLAKYPGPLLQRISSWPLILQCHRGNRHLVELENHRRYGRIVRYAPDSLSFSNPVALQEIHGAKANIKKGDWYLTLDISAGAPSTQMVIDAKEHVLRRRNLAPAFSARALQEAEELITKSAENLVNNVFSVSQDEDKKREWSQPVNMKDWATWFGFDFVSDLAYGAPFAMLQREEYRWIPNALMHASVFLYYAGYLPFAAMVRLIMGTQLQSWVFGKDAEDSLRYTNLANGMLSNRIKLETKLKETGSEAARKDTFHHLLNNKDQRTGRDFTVEELQADSALLIAAGSDGVGLTLSATVFYLLCNPGAMMELTKEIRSAFPTASSIKNPALGSLPYLSACLEETLRMCPPKPSTLPRVVLSEGMVIDGEYIPPGTTVGTPTYVMQHDETAYPEPWQYRPERWIVSPEAGVSAADVAAARAAFSPFLIGSLNCIGKNMSYIALKLALAHLLYCYDIRRAGAPTGGGRPDMEPGRQRENEYQMSDWILGFRDGPMVELRRR